jgi:hypothetical protein
LFQKVSNIDRNWKRTESLSHGCDSLFRSTEIFAFDFFFAGDFMGQVLAAQVYCFLKHCIHPLKPVDVGCNFAPLLIAV